jgi:hypothetical protein
MWVFFGILVSTLPLIGLYLGKFHELIIAGGFWVVFLFLLVPLYLSCFLQRQRVTLSSNSISHLKATLKGSLTKSFNIKDIEFWAREGSNNLVIKLKGGHYPNFPYGPSEDLNSIIIISPIFKSKHAEIINFMESHGIREKNI